MENIKDDYFQMYEFYNVLNDYIIPHINNNTKLKYDIFQISTVFDFGKTLIDKIKKDAVSVYKNLPKNTKTSLKYKDEKTLSILNNYSHNHIITSIEYDIEFLNYSGLVNKCLFNTHFIFGDGLKVTVIKYDLLPKAYKKLNDALFYHINGTQYLSIKELNTIISVILYIFTTLKTKAFDSCQYSNDIQKHRKIEEYFNAPISINKDCSLIESDIIIFNEHLEWKKKRVKYLKKKFPEKQARCPHDEEYFVKHKMMYNEDY